MTKDRVCQNCFKAFQVRRPSDNGVCCSYTCAGEIKRRLPEPEARACDFCLLIFTPPRKLADQRFCSKACWLHSNHTPEHQRAACVARNVKSRGTGKKARYVKRDGRHEHRTVAEEKIGRPLLPGEVVHHRDDNGKNNDPGNLKVFKTQAEHMREHGLGLPGVRPAHEPWKARWQ